MQILKYLFAKIICRLKNDDEVMCDYFRREGMRVGKNCHIYSNIATSESYLIHIGDNVTISNGVQLITHDNSICKVLPEFTDTFGFINIGRNSFIGAKTVILPGVNLPDHTIVGSGSVVTKSFTEQRIIIAGNPAKKISTWDQYEQKRGRVAVNITGCSAEVTKERALWSAEESKKLE